jgi:hypothetical protein
VKKATLILGNTSMEASTIHKFRGYVGNLFRDKDIIHNHNLKTGTPIYRYPLIQFKLIERRPAIIAISEMATTMFAEVFMKLQEVKLDNLVIPIFDKSLEIEEVDFGFSDQMLSYQFISPWIALNQNNYRKYLSLKEKTDKDNLLQRSLTGNILSLAKGLDNWLGTDQRIETELKVEPHRVKLKGENLLGFSGLFQTNFQIPNYLGLGKSISRGYGTVKKV